jgi:hypothetical protein
MIRASSRLLRVALRANALFSLACGVLLLVAAGRSAALLGVSSSVPASATGAALILFAAALLRLSGRPAVRAALVRAVVGLDLLWVLASLVLLWLPATALTNPGRAAVAATAASVLILASLQALGLWRSPPSPSPR